MRYRDLITAGVATLVLATNGPVAAQLPPEAEIPAFYAAFENAPKQAGAWLAAEAMPAALRLPGAGRQLRFVYGATDGVGQGDVVVVSGAIFLPAGPPPAGGWPIVAWAHGTVGIADHCAPSVAGRSARDLGYLTAWMNAGFAVVATDYQGLGTPGPHPYLNNRAAAYSVLDAVRAARQGVEGLANKVLIVGQSQGAAAAISTAAYAPDYSPEIRVIGTVATGVPNAAASLSRANRTERDAAAFDPAVAYLLYLAASATAANPGHSPAGAVHARAMPAYHAAAKLCAMPLLQMVRGEGLTQANAIGPAFMSTYAAAIQAVTYPRLGLAKPLFVGIGQQDVDTPASGQLAIVQDACAAGTVVEAHLYKGGDHSSTVNPSFRHSVVFARKMLAGERLAARCQTTLENLEAGP